LIGDIKNPKIYGAGLLSSIGESIGALSDNVVKIPYSIDAMDYSFDITKPQPQLFVTPDFKTLITVLDEFADQMALRTGGLEGIMKAIESGATATLVYSSGLQVSGTVSDVIIHNGLPAYIKTTGPTILSVNDKMLEGHSKAHHKDGFGSPVGGIKGLLKPTRLLDDRDLKSLGIEKGKMCAFEFESGVKVTGKLQRTERNDKLLVILTFSDCKVTYEDQVLFEPAWGVYDMAVGEKITSAFGGPADPEGFGLHYEAPEEKTHQIDFDDQAIKLHQLYNKTRQIRESKFETTSIRSVWENVKSEFPEDWLLPVEILEIVKKNKINSGFPEEIEQHLTDLRSSNPKLDKLISNGLTLSG
jgi:phenylalanine-4-hydroxylase